MSVLANVREAEGLTLEETAQRAGISVNYLKRIERGGGCAYPLALRLARLYRQSANVFLTKGQSGDRTRNTANKTPHSRAKRVGQREFADKSRRTG